MHYAKTLGQTAHTRMSPRPRTTDPSSSHHQIPTTYRRDSRMDGRVDRLLDCDGLATVVSRQFQTVTVCSRIFRLVKTPSIPQPVQRFARESSTSSFQQIGAIRCFSSAARLDLSRACLGPSQKDESRLADAGRLVETLGQVERSAQGLQPGGQAGDFPRGSVLVHDALLSSAHQLGLGRL